MTDQTSLTQVACSWQACNIFKLNCLAGKRILILQAMYKINETKVASARETPTNDGRQAREQPATAGNQQCPKIPGCNQPPNSCCPNAEQKYVDMPYSPQHLYRFLEKCSGKSACKAQAEYSTPYHNRNSISCSVSYRCVPGKFHQVYPLAPLLLYVVNQASGLFPKISY